MKVLFFGHDEVGARALRRLIDDGHVICGVVLRAEAKSDALEHAAVDLRLPTLRPARVNGFDVLDWARALAPDLVVSVNYNQIFGPALLALAPRGAVNVHNGMLPNYGGGGGLYGAVINGETAFGQTAHFMIDRIDAGDIIVQRTIPIRPDDTMAELTARSVEHIGDTIGEAVAVIAQGRVVARPQGERGSYFPRKPDGDELIDWSETSALLLRKIRARRPGPGNVTYCGEQCVTIWKAAATSTPAYIGPVGQVIARGDAGVVVKTGDSVILVQEVQVDDGPIVVPRLPLGTCFLANWRKAYVDLRASHRALDARVATLEAALQSLRAGVTS